MFSPLEFLKPIRSEFSLAIANTQKQIRRNKYSLVTKLYLSLANQKLALVVLKSLSNQKRVFIGQMEREGIVSSQWETNLYFLDNSLQPMKNIDNYWLFNTKIAFPFFTIPKNTIPNSEVYLLL